MQPDTRTYTLSHHTGSNPVDMPVTQGTTLEYKTSLVPSLVAIAETYLPLASPCSAPYD